MKPYFDYCSPLRDNCGGCHKFKLQRQQNRASTGSTFDIRSDYVLIMLHLESVDQIRNYIKSIHMYKIINDLAAPNLKQLFRSPFTLHGQSKDEFF